jgi:hypothetical protein
MKHITITILLIIFTLTFAVSQNVGKPISEIVAEKGEPSELKTDSENKLQYYVYKDSFKIIYTVQNDSIERETWILTNPFIYTMITYTLYSFGYYQLCPVENLGIYYRNYYNNIEAYIEDRSWVDDIIVHFYEK